uniref:Uncharacterized protein n=1 Tax=Anguilla anguilla TaxID=7936 RepID=A0A0E9W5H8_ANGAN
MLLAAVGTIVFTLVSRSEYSLVCGAAAG